MHIYAAQIIYNLLLFFSPLLFTPSYTFHTTSLGQWMNIIPSFAQGLNLGSLVARRTLKYAAGCNSGNHLKI